MKLADVKVVVIVAVLPLEQTIDKVNQAAAMINDGKYYEASQDLRQVQASQRFDVVDDMATAASIAIVATAVQAENLTGAGGTAIYPVLSKWADQYAAKTGNDVNYQAIGSGGGIEQIEAKTVLFANTDMPLKPEDVEKNNLVQFPQVIISITPVVNLKGIKPGEPVFDRPTLADVFLGKITEWDDPAIKKPNPKVSLQHQAIITVHRYDGSGTTFNFTNYLSKVSPGMEGQGRRQHLGQLAKRRWRQGQRGRGGFGAAGRRLHRLCRIRLCHPEPHDLCRHDNKDGKTVAPTMAAFQAAAIHADFSKVKDFYLILTDQPGPESWPITAAPAILAFVASRTRSPLRKAVTLAPTSSTTPTPSCPTIRPGAQVGTSPFRICKSVPQIVVLVTPTIASVGAMIFGDGRCSTALLSQPMINKRFHRKTPIIQWKRRQATQAALLRCLNSARAPRQVCLSLPGAARFGSFSTHFIAD